MLCKDGSQDFALYLPAHYNVAQEYPCIYLFDPHGHGALPVKMYKELAEKYGFVLVGCNSSKNGMQWQITHSVIQALMADTKARIHIDPKRIYTAGFSGGARVASSVALSDGGIAGVIGSGAGFPNGGGMAQNLFSFFGLVGNQDFNLIEMSQLDSTLEQNNFPHQLVVFNGKHAWPPVADFNTALLWMQVNAMREHLEPVNNEIVHALKIDYDKRITAAKEAGDMVATRALKDGAFRVLQVLTDAASYEHKPEGYAAENAYKDAAYDQYLQQKSELRQQQEFAKHFTLLDEKWWAKKTEQLDQSAQGKTPEALMDRRLLNYLGLISYMNSSHAIQTSDLPNAELYLKVFKMADPQNPDQRYLLAQYYMKKGDNAQAITALREAAALNYNDLSQLLADPAFAPLQGDAGFQDVVKKVKANAVK